MHRLLSIPIFKKVIVFLLVGQMFASVLAFPLLSLVRSYSRVRLVDKFHELISTGVVSPSLLKKEYPELSPYELQDLSSFFLGDALDLPVKYGTTLSILSFLTVSFLLIWKIAQVGTEPPKGKTTN